METQVLLMLSVYSGLSHTAAFSSTNIEFKLFFHFRLFSKWFARTIMFSEWIQALLQQLLC